jgi:hypothetical protein
VVEEVAEEAGDAVVAEGGNVRKYKQQRFAPRGPRRTERETAIKLLAVKNFKNINRNI